jgi:hypothetical protein
MGKDGVQGESKPPEPAQSTKKRRILTVKSEPLFFSRLFMLPLAKVGSFSESANFLHENFARRW